MENFLAAAAANPQLVYVTLFMGTFLAIAFTVACALVWEEVTAASRRRRRNRY